jgi:hypothetical protein
MAIKSVRSQLNRFFALKPFASGVRARGIEAVTIGGGLGTLIVYVDCPIAYKKDKQRSALLYSNKKLPVGLPEALVFPDGLLGKTELLGLIDAIPCNAVLFICVHRFGHSVGVTGLPPAMSTASSTTLRSQQAPAAAVGVFVIVCAGYCVFGPSARASLQHTRLRYCRAKVSSSSSSSSISSSSSSSSSSSTGWKC